MYALFQGSKNLCLEGSSSNNGISGEIIIIDFFCACGTGPNWFSSFSVQRLKVLMQQAKV